MVAQNSPAATSDREIVLTRVFDAPRELIWTAWTDPEHVVHWWGPKGFTVIASKMDLRPGGMYLYGMQAPDGTPMWGRFTFREITPKDRMVFINSFSDEAGGVTRHPMAPTWPLEMLSTFTFEDLPGGKTRFTVRWKPHNATEVITPTASCQQTLVFLVLAARPCSMPAPASLSATCDWCCDCRTDVRVRMAWA